MTAKIMQLCQPPLLTTDHVRLCMLILNISKGPQVIKCMVGTATALSRVLATMAAVRVGYVL